MISLSVNLVLWCNSLEHFVSINLLLTGCMRLWLNICLCLVSSGGDFVSQPWWTTSPSQSDSMVSMASVHRNRRPPANSFCMPTLRSDLLLTPNSVVVIQYFYLKWRKKWTTPWNNREASHFRAISKRIVNSVCIVCLCYAAIFFNHFSLFGKLFPLIHFCCNKYVNQQTENVSIAQSTQYYFLFHCRLCFWVQNFFCKMKTENWKSNS